MTTVSHGKPYAGNPHVRFEEGASESAKPSRKALLHTQGRGIYDTARGELRHSMEGFMTQCGLRDEALGGLRKGSRAAPTPRGETPRVR